MTKEPTLTIFVDYDRAGYTDAEIDTLKAGLSEIGATRTRGRDVPAATDQVMIDIVVSVVGASLFEYAVKTILSRLAGVVRALRESRKVSGKQQPVLHTVTLSFDDVDVVVYHPSDEDLDEIPATLELMRDALRKNRLKGLLIQKIEMPLDLMDDEWVVPEYEACLDKGPRTLWALTGSYEDLEPRTLYDAARDELLPPASHDEC